MRGFGFWPRRFEFHREFEALCGFLAVAIRGPRIRECALNRGRLFVGLPTGYGEFCGVRTNRIREFRRFAGFHRMRQKIADFERVGIGTGSR